MYIVQPEPIIIDYVHLFNSDLPDIRPDIWPNTGAGAGAGAGAASK